MIRLILALLMLAVASPSWGATISAARTTGVAPLLVVFHDSDITASSGSSRPFHDREYTWSFGDTNAGTWGTDGTSKNIAKGGVSAHVFDTAGTYTVTLTVRDSTGTIGTDTETITVSDPDTIYAGTLTTCLNNVGDSDFTGCPSGATHLNNNNLTASDVTNSVQVGERLLLKRGNSWTISSFPQLPDNTGPTTIGAYGTCTTPDSSGRCSNAPHINSPAGEGFYDIQRKRDFRVMDLNFTGGAICGTNGEEFRQGLFYRLDISDTVSNEGIGWGHWVANASLHVPISQMGVVDSSVVDSAHYGMYVGGEHIAVLGNYIYRTTITHGLRVWQSYRGVVAHNIIAGISTDYTVEDGGGRHALKFSGPDDQDEDPEHCEPATGTSCLQNRTAFSIISDNLFGASLAPVMINPQSTSADAVITDVVFEKNRLVADYGPDPLAGNTFRGVQVSGQYITIRNNILDGTNGNVDYAGITVNGSDYPRLTIDRNSIYNNTCYRSDAPNDTNRCVQISAGATNTIVRNNLFSAPNAASYHTLMMDYGTGTVASNNLMTDEPEFVDAENATILSRNFALTEDSDVVIDLGYTTPLLDDFAGASRVGLTYDIGAYEYGAGGASPTCVDGIQNGDETDVDCGGSCSACGGGGGAGYTAIGAGTTPIGSGTTAITP